MVFKRGSSLGAHGGLFHAPPDPPTLLSCFHSCSTPVLLMLLDSLGFCFFPFPFLFFFPLDFLLSDQIRCVTSGELQGTRRPVRGLLRPHISPPMMYIKTASLLPRVKMFVPPTRRLGVPELVSPCCDYFIMIMIIF